MNKIRSPHSLHKITYVTAGQVLDLKPPHIAVTLSLDEFVKSSEDHLVKVSSKDLHILFPNLELARETFELLLQKVLADE